MGLRPWARRVVAERITSGAVDLTDTWTLPEAITALIIDLVTQQTVVLRERLTETAAELDAANDAVTELVAQLDDARTGREHVVTVYGSVDELFADMERGA